VLGLVTIAAAPPEKEARERGVRAELHVASPSSDQLESGHTRGKIILAVSEV